MTITGFKTTRVEIPLKRRIRTALHDMHSIGCVLLELESDQGVTGQAYVFSLNALRLGALHEMVRGFSDIVKGRNPYYIHRILDDMWQQLNPIGHKGYSIAALSVIDTACWDLLGKLADKPLHYLFGACRERVWTYASSGLWLSNSIDELVQEAVGFVNTGFRAMKIRLGSHQIADDIERVRAVREAIGPDIELLTDANQALTVKHAIRLGRALEEFNIGWLEEPVSYLNLDGHAEVRAALAMDIASGETEYTRFGMHAMLKANAVDILMPDLQRVGGLSEMRRTAAIASVYHIPISTHLFTEHSLCIAASEPNCISVEHLAWCSNLFNESLQLNEGYIQVPHRPGTGFTFNRETIRKFRIA